MMAWSSWALFAFAVTLLCLTPGPAVLFVVAQALRFGGRRSLWATGGILLGNAIYFVVGAAGLGAILLASHRLYLALRYLGAAYLIYLGVKTFLGRGLGLELDGEASAPAALGGADRPEEFDRPGGSGHPDRAGRALLGRALLVQLSNPKAVLFVTAFVPQFLDSGRPVLPQLVILGLTGQAIEIVILGAYGYFAGAATHLARQPRFAALTNRISGVLLIAIGAGLAFAART